MAIKSRSRTGNAAELTRTQTSQPALSMRSSYNLPGYCSATVVRHAWVSMRRRRAVVGPSLIDRWTSGVCNVRNDLRACRAKQPAQRACFSEDLKC